MGIFSRRNVQRTLNENQHFLEEGVLREHVNRLNGKDTTQRLTTEWEVVVLNGLSKLGAVEYEPKLPGKSKIDVLFSHNLGNALIDITTVSDRGLDEENPVQRLSDELIKRVRKRGLNPNHFGLRVVGNWRELHLGGPKPRLDLPGPRDFAALFGSDFYEFLEHTKSSEQSQSLRRRLVIHDNLTITFDPKQPFFSSSYLDYKVPFTLENNPIHNRLHSKAQQLKKATFQGCKGIVLCDAGCWALTRQGRRGIDFDAKDIIQGFLEKNSSIAFVLVLLVVGDRTGQSGPDHLKVVSRLYRSRKHDPVDQLGTFLQKRLQEDLPQPEDAPASAYSDHCEGKSFYGGGTRMGRNIKISARTVLGVLSGRIKQEDFLLDHRGFVEHFGRMLTEGRMLKGAAVEKCPQRDDDWIEFSFSEPDSAISPFKMP